MSAGDFLEEYEIFINSTGPYLDSKNITIPEINSAYIYEVNNYKHYLTVNGLRGIYTNDDDVFMAGDINNICFQEGANEKQVGYTVSYIERNPNIEKIFEWSPGLQNRSTWLHTVEQLNLDKEKYTGQLLLSDQEYDQLKTKYTQLPEAMGRELYDLARYIGINASSDVQVAKSIEQYLKTDGGYTYVYGAPQKNEMADPIYDFLFNQKQGICQDFASGMVLLCRSLGLPTRYVCGYYSEEKDGDQKYIIREKNAHAFVEVYISGYGWMLFDPTPSSSQRDLEVEAGRLGGVGNFYGEIPINELLRLVYRLLVPMLLLILFWILAKAANYLYWRQKILSGKPEESIEHLLKEIVQLIKLHEYEILEGETYEQLSDRLLRDKVDITYITRPFVAYY